MIAALLPLLHGAAVENSNTTALADDSQSIDKEEDQELDPHTMFVDNVVTIDVSDTPVALQETCVFSEKRPFGFCSE